MSKFMHYTTFVVMPNGVKQVPNIKSAIKRARQNISLRQQNASARSKLRTYVGKSLMFAAYLIASSIPPISSTKPISLAFVPIQTLPFAIFSISLGD